MPDRPQSTPINRPFRTGFTCHLEPDARRTVERFGDLLESALLEYTHGSGEEPFALTLSRAVSTDLGVLLADTRHAVESWPRSSGTTGPELRHAMAETLALLENAHATLSTALREEGAADAD
ncbi:MAG: hypothetical protein PVI57_17960 [Gemmatimonadota bacterium]|jgi:hypothetical protein